MSVAWRAGRMAWPPKPKRMTPNEVPNVENVTFGVSVYGSCFASETPHITDPATTTTNTCSTEPHYDNHEDK